MDAELKHANYQMSLICPKDTLGHAARRRYISGLETWVLFNEVYRFEIEERDLDKALLNYEVRVESEEAKGA